MFVVINNVILRFHPTHYRRFKIGKTFFRWRLPPEMERSRISSWNLRHFPKWCSTAWWCRWSGSVTMTAGWSRSCFARLSLWWHPLSRVMVALPCSGFWCTSSIFSSSSKVACFWHTAGDLAWKDVGKYHSCIHKRRKSWSNKSFESLLQHVSVSDGQLVQHMFQCSILGS